MHEETAVDAIAKASLKKAKEKVAKKRRKGKLAGEVHAITAKIKQEEKEKKEKKLSKKELEINERVKSLRKWKIENISEQIKQAAEKGNSYTQVSALWSNAVEIRLLHIIQEWAKEQGFDIDTSYNEIYESPRSSDDLPSDTRSFLTISWE
jgi:hypothetical protein